MRHTATAQRAAEGTRKLQLPVATKNIGEFQIQIDGTIVASVVSVAADVTAAELPQAWQSLVAPGKQTWFRSPRLASFAWAFRITCVSLRIVGTLGPPPAWMTEWSACGMDAGDALEEWVDYTPNSGPKYTPTKVLCQRVASIERDSPITGCFGVSFELLGHRPAALHWYRRHARLATPFVNANGAFVPEPGDYVTHVAFPIASTSGWQERKGRVDP